MKTVKDYRGYVYTIPKAGTYLMSEFLSQIGSISTGWHISVNDYLDTLGFDTATNKVTPSKTAKPRLYIASFKRIPNGHHAFGHLSPMFVPPMILSNRFKCLCVRRHPKEVLVSEFIDFRFRRNDVDFVNQQKIPDTLAAFEQHLIHHGPTTVKLCRNFAFLEQSTNNPLYAQTLPPETFLFLNFKEFLSKDTGPAAARRIANFFNTNLSNEMIEAAWKNALDADNKTKSQDTELEIPRSHLWTDGAEKIYQELGFPSIEAYF